MSKLYVNTIQPNSGDTVTVSGSLITTGKLTIGDASTDTVAFEAEISSSLIPDVDDTYDLGAPTKQWRNLYIDGTANIDSASAQWSYATTLIGFSGSFSKISSNLVPTSNNSLKLGTSTNKWRDLHVDNIGYIDLVTGSLVRVAKVQTDILDAGTISASAMPTSEAGASSGEFYTLSGSQLFSSSLVTSGHMNDFVTASLFVFLKP